MILLTTMRGEEFVLNSDLIESIHANPDTTIKLVSGNLMLVKESKEEIIEKVVAFRHKIMTGIIPAEKND